MIKYVGVDQVLIKQRSISSLLLSWNAKSYSDQSTGLKQTPNPAWYGPGSDQAQAGRCSIRSSPFYWVIGPNIQAHPPTSLEVRPSPCPTCLTFRPVILLRSSPKLAQWRLWLVWGIQCIWAKQTRQAHCISSPSHEAHLWSVQPSSHSFHPKMWLKAQFLSHRTFNQRWVELKKYSTVKMTLEFKVVNQWLE